MPPPSPAAFVPPLAGPEAPVLGQVVAEWTQHLGLLGLLVVVEVLAALAAWLEKALEAHSRAGLVEAAEARGTPERAERVWKRLPVYLLSARIVRFLAKAVLVVGLASWALGDVVTPGEGGLVPVPWGSLAVVLCLAFLVNFVINDVLVGVFARRAPDRMLVASAGLLEGLRVATAPLRVPLTLLVRLVFRVAIDNPPPDTRDEVLESVTEGEREGALSATEAQMIGKIIDLPERTAADVLIPRAQVSMLQADTRLPEAIAFIREDGHTRVPVYGRDRDDVLGWVHARDLLQHVVGAGDAARTVREVMRPPYFVPGTKPLDELLAEMRSRKIHLAVVLNELSATAGVVSLEDLLEEIVGDIHDEHDVEDRRLPRPEDVVRGDVTLDARVHVEDANRLLKLALPLDPAAYDTLAGLLLHRLGRIPRPGESLEVDGAALTVVEADARRVRRVRLKVLRPAPTSADDA